MTLDALLAALYAAYRKDTSELSDRWTLDKPSTGHCHVASLVLHQWLGGTIWRHYVDHSDGIDVHYTWSSSNGVHVDATRDQFEKISSVWGQEDATNELLGDVTRHKYEVLFNRVSERLQVAA